MRASTNRIASQLGKIDSIGASFVRPLSLYLWGHKGMAWPPQSVAFVEHLCLFTLACESHVRFNRITVRTAVELISDAYA